MKRQSSAAGTSRNPSLLDTDMSKKFGMQDLLPMLPVILPFASRLWRRGSRRTFASSALSSMAIMFLAERFMNKRMKTS